MLLTIHNLPLDTRYSDVKLLLQTKCGVAELILDNLLPEGNCKKVTVGVAEEKDAAIILTIINGLYFNGKQLYVEDVKKKESNIGAVAQRSRIPTMVPPPSAMNYETPIPGMYLMQSGQSSSFTGYAGQSQVESQPVFQPQRTEYPDQQRFFQGHAINRDLETNWNLTSTAPANLRNCQRDSSDFSYGNTQTPNQGRGNNFNRNPPTRDPQSFSRWQNPNMASTVESRRESTLPRVWASHDPSQGGSPRSSSRHTDIRQPESTRQSFDRSYVQNQPSKPFEKFAAPSADLQPAYGKSSLNNSRTQPNKIFSMLFNKQGDAYPSINASSSFSTHNETSGRVDRAQNLSNKRKIQWNETSREIVRNDPPSAQNYRPKNRYSPPPKRVRNTDSNFKESHSEKPLGKSQYGVNEPGRPSHDTRQKPLSAVQIQNRDETFKGQAVSSIVNDIMRNVKDKIDKSSKVSMKKLKESVRERVCKLLGDRIMTPPDMIIKIYRRRFTKKDDPRFYSSVLKLKPVLSTNNPDEKESGAPQENAKDKSDATKVNPIDPPMKLPMPNPVPEVVVSKRIPKYPKGDKGVYKEERQQVKMEFSKQLTYGFDNKEMDKMFKIETEVICEKFKESCTDPSNELEEYFCKQVSSKPDVLNDFRETIKLQVSKRLLNIGPILLRIYYQPTRPKRPILDDFLRPFGVISLKKSRKPMYTASFKSYDAIDRLCAMQTVVIDDVTLAFKPMYLTEPKSKFNKKRIEQNRNDLIKRQIDYSNELNLLENTAVKSVDFASDANCSQAADNLDTKSLTNDPVKEFDDDASALAKEMIKTSDDKNIDAYSIVKTENYDNDLIVNKKSDDLIFYEDFHGDFTNDDVIDNFKTVGDVKSENTAEDVNVECVVNEDDEDESETTVNIAENHDDVSKTNVNLAENQSEVSQTNSAENDEDLSNEDSTKPQGNLCDDKDATKTNLVENHENVSNDIVDLTENDKNTSNPQISLSENGVSVPQVGLAEKSNGDVLINVEENADNIVNADFEDAGEDAYPDVDINELSEDDLEDY